mgnify:CR=1 FL=1
MLPLISIIPSLGTPAQFEVSWDGAVNIVTGQPYTPNGSEMSTPFTGDRAYTVPASQTKARLKFSRKVSAALTEEAVESLAEAKSMHDTHRAHL